MHRIGKSSKPVHSPGPQTAQRTYLLTAENLVAAGPHTVLADVLFTKEEVSLTGDYAGPCTKSWGQSPLMDYRYPESLLSTPIARFRLLSLSL